MVLRFLPSVGGNSVIAFLSIVGIIVSSFGINAGFTHRVARKINTALKDQNTEHTNTIKELRALRAATNHEEDTAANKAKNTYNEYKIKTRQTIKEQSVEHETNKTLNLGEHYKNMESNTRELAVASRDSTKAMGSYEEAVSECKIAVEQLNRASEEAINAHSELTKLLDEQEKIQTHGQVDADKSAAIHKAIIKVIVAEGKLETNLATARIKAESAIRQDKAKVGNENTAEQFSFAGKVSQNPGADFKAERERMQNYIGGLEPSQKDDLKNEATQVAKDSDNQALQSFTSRMGESSDQEPLQNKQPSR